MQIGRQVSEAHSAASFPADTEVIECWFENSAGNDSCDIAFIGHHSTFRQPVPRGQLVDTSGPNYLSILTDCLLRTVLLIKEAGCLGSFF